MNDYTYTFTHKAENYEIRLTEDKVKPDHYLVSGQQVALQALGLQPSSLVTLADVRARFEACQVTNVVCEKRVNAAALQILAPDSLVARFAKSTQGVTAFDPKNPSVLQVVSVDSLMEQYNVPGASIAIFDQGTVCHKGFGDLKDEKRLIQAASVSKMVTALTVLSLVKEGHLHLDDDVSTLLKGHWTSNLPLNEQKMTIRHLLCHAAGTTISGYSGHPAGTTLTTDEIIRDVKVDHLPDINRFQYSGGGTMLLQKIIELTCGNRPFADIVREHIFVPLGMDHSSYSPEKEQKPTASGHGVRAEPVQRAYPEHAAAGLWSTPEDLVKVAMAIQRAYDGEDESIITQALAREMLTAQSPDEPNGLGVFVDTLKKSIVFHHPGENAGFTCVLVANNAKQGACIMTNSEHGQALWKDVVRSVAKECAWPDSENLPMCKPLCTAAEVGPIADKSEWSAKYAGTYSPKNNQGSSIEVTAECLKEEGCPPYEIVYLGEGACIFREFTPGPPDKFSFSEDAAGTLTLHVFDKEFILNKVV